MRFQADKNPDSYTRTHMTYGNWSVVICPVFHGFQVQVWVSNPCMRIPEVLPFYWSTGTFQEAQGILEQILDILSPLSNDSDPSLVVKVLRIFLLREYGDIFDGNGAVLCRRQDPYWKPRDWSQEMDVLETGRHRYPIDLTMPPLGDTLRKIT